MGKLLYALTCFGLGAGLMALLGKCPSFLRGNGAYLTSDFFLNRQMGIDYGILIV